MENIQIPLDIINELGISQIIDIRDKLPVNPNYTWAQLSGVRNPEDLTTQAIHHDAWPKHVTAKYTDLELAKRIANDHIALKRNEPKGDAGFPYHIWIRGGNIYLCNNILDRTYGVGSNNGYTVHVCVSGDYFTYDAMTEFERKALYGVILTLKRYGITEYKGHNEFPGNATSCPGIDLNRVREEVLSLEMKFQRESTWSAKIKKVDAIANQFNYMNSLIRKGPDDGEAHWAVNEQLKLYDLMKQQKLL